MFKAETGQGLEDANSYASVQDFKDWAALRPRVTVPENDSDIEKALVAATDWIDGNFARFFKGSQQLAMQALQWPRSGIPSPDGNIYPLGYMPPQLIKATCTLAVEALTGALWTNMSGATLQVIEKTTGPLTTKYNPVKPADMVVQRNFDEVRAMLSPLCKGFAIMSVSR